jgi:type IV pilus assembly protein PilV
MCALNRRSGFTLIETLVALLVVSVGLIGLAALQIRAVAAGAEAVHRSIAIGLSVSMAERIRANRTATVAYSAAAADAGCDAAVAAAPGDCSPPELAASDLFVWQREVVQTLPGGRGSITVDATGNPAQYTVSVQWREPAAADPLAVSLTFRQRTW